MIRRTGAGGVPAAMRAAVSGLAAQSAQNGSWVPVDAARVVVGRPSAAGPPALQAVRIRGVEIEIDGRAVEAPWLQAPVASQFTQFEPHEGEPATERTEARVLYGDDALYVAIRAWESDAQEIVGQLTRRDQESYSDKVGVVVDSYFDRRTAFQFAVNPVGVKVDVYHFDDTNEDSGWDAVWDVATTRDDEGWTAEFRIPYSQLRFRDAPVQTWGIEFYREIARREELSLWAPLSRQESAIVSKFGELQGLEDLAAPRRLEVLPYSVARLTRAPGEAGDPFHRANEGFGTVGADVKFGVTSNLTLDMTLNPDFGQVEADPAQVNLTAFETFFPERRPFFLEGSGIFRFGIALGDGDGANESLFYSRRIGRAPQGSVDGDGHTDSDPQTTILGAWKLSGKTADGWSVGVLHALTSEEKARVAPEVGVRYETPIEPLTNHSMVRLQRDFRGGRSAVGVIGTAVNRDRGVAADLELRDAAYAGGVDFRHRFAGERYEVAGYLLGSHVRGSSDAIARTQRSAVRYFQRPDAESFTYDPTRTDLSGGSAYLSFARIGGEHWRFSTGLHTRSPGFEVNDMGYQRDADSFVNWAWVQYQQSTPQGPFRRWNVNANGWMGRNYDWDLGGLGGNVNGSFQLNNFWGGYAGVNRDLSAYSGGALRGGPLFRREASTNFFAGLFSDSRKVVQLDLNTWGNVAGERGSWSAGLSPHVSFRPSGRATFSVGTSLNWNHDDSQWVDSFEGDRADYLFARIEQTTVGLSLQGEYAFTPTLSLQVYAEPFVSAGSYGEYKRVADPRADGYADRFETLFWRRAGDEILLDVDGDGNEESFERPDFNFKQFRSNTVLRWEYRPGSVLFLVWSQGRNAFIEDGRFDLRNDVSDLFRADAENVFMIKASYWLSR
ncbi:MAG: carbohydrate binding family 9 domain-containing protein [Gemmatimonadetes bacterium]|nr:carbohydrate binding family 9 domain-containing protein [Gemmatimonadota bacterium]